MELMKPNFKFKVLSDVFLSPTDMQSLTLLYQPIIGVDAFSLYFLLLNLPLNAQKKHHLLLQINGSSMESLIDNRHRLEAAGLIDVYNTDDLVTYVLKQPLSIKQFFNDAIMRAFLYVKIGAQDFNALKNMLIPNSEQTTSNKPTGDKMTKRFDEVFDVKALKRIDQNLQATNEIVRSGQGIEIATAFDSTMLSDILVKKGISEKVLTSNLLRILNELAFLYKFDVHELARLVFDASLPDGAVDLVKMKLLARTQFQLMSSGANVQVVVKDEQVKVKKVVQERSKERIIAFLEQSPVDFLRFKSGGVSPVPADMKLVEWLYTDQGMAAGVVNVLVDYVLNYTDGKLPKQLVEKIAGQWQRQGVNTTQDAMDKVAKSLTKSSEYKQEQQKPLAKKKAPVAEAIPEWFGKDNEQSQMSTEEDAAAKKEIEEMRSAFLKEAR